MENVLALRAEIIDSANQRDLDGVTHTRRNIRERAICALTGSLDSEKEVDQAIFQTIPLEFLERGDLIGAIWYIETIGTLGNIVSPEVLEKVLNKAFTERRECLAMEDEESLRVVDHSIASLLRMAKKHFDLSKNLKITLLEGGFEEEKGNPYKAIRIYDQGIGQGNIDAYLASARIYENLGKLDMSRAILETGCQVTSDLTLFGNLIRILCKQGEYNYALFLYTEYKQALKNQSSQASVKLRMVEHLGDDPIDQVLPFLIYKGVIQSDRDLEELESILASYITEGSLIPSEALAQLSENARVYVAEKIHTLNHRIDTLNNKPINEWLDKEKEEYWESLFRRLWYMQADILTLGNGRYLERYLSEIDRVAFGDLQILKGELSNFFLEHFSPEVDEQARHRGEIEDRLEKVNPRKPNSIFEDISLHVARIWDLFSTVTYYDIQESQIAPLLRKSAIAEGEYDDDMESELSETLWSMRDGDHYYHSLRAPIRENYENFIKSIDKKYGVFYRRHIQNLAIEPSLPPEKYPKALLEYPDIAMLFWIEKILSSQFPVDNPEDIEKFVTHYGLDKCDILTSLLFGSLIYDVSIEYAIMYLAIYPNMLDVPEAIYIITEGLRQMDPKNRKLTIKDLHKLAQEEYGARGFFEHIRFTFSDIIRNSDPSEEDQSEMLLASGNMAILQRKERALSILNFQTAATEYGSLDGLLQAGDSYEDDGDYDRALWLFEQAFIQDSSIQVVTKILRLAIRSARFDLAFRYIQYGLSRSYSIGSYILAYHLGQGNTQSALLQIINMIQNKENPIDTPEGTMQLLMDTLNEIIQKPDSNDEITDILKIQASFVLSNLGTSINPVDAFTMLPHWQYIASLIGSYEGDTLHRVIETSLSSILWNLDKGELDELGSSDRSITFISEHAKKIINTCEQRIQGETDEKKLLEYRKMMNEIAGLAVMILRSFPGSEKEVTMFLSELEFFPSETYTPLSREYRLSVSATIH